MVEKPIAGGSNSKEAAESGKFGSGRKGFNVINTFNLSVAFSNKVILIPFNGPIIVILPFVDLFATNELVTR